MNKKRGAGAIVGGSSLLVIFAVLCLVIFSLLSLSTARAGERLSLNSAQAVSNYYQADRAAEEMLARLRAGERPAEVTEYEDIYSYSCPISDTQALEVSVQLRGDGYSVLRWQSVSTVDWESDETLNLWDGES